MTDPSTPNPPQVDGNLTSDPLYLAFVVAMFALLAVVWWLTERGPAKKNRDKPRPLTNPWATTNDVAELVTDSPQPGRILMASWHEPRAGGFLPSRRKYLSTLPEHWLCVTGGARSYKTLKVVAPAVRAWAGPAIVASTKPDLLNLTRKARGTCWAFYPGKTVADMPTVGWNPLDAIRDALDVSPERAQTVAIRTATAMTRGTDTKDPFWIAAAADLLAPLMLAAAVNKAGQGVTDVLNWINAQDYGEPISILVSTNYEGMARALERYEETTPTTTSANFTAKVALKAYSDPLVLAGTTAPLRFRPSWLLSGDHDRATLYLLGDALTQRELGPIFLGLVEELTSAIYERADAADLHKDVNDPSPTIPPEKHVLMALDEAANIVPNPNLDILASSAGSRGLAAILAYQDLSQVRERFGAEKAGTIVANCQARLVTRGMADDGTLEMFSKLFGSHAVWMNSHSTAKGGNTASRSLQTQPIVSASDIRQLPKGKALVLYSAFPPIRTEMLDLRTAMPESTPLPPESATGATPARAAEPVKVHQSATR